MCSAVRDLLSEKVYVNRARMCARMHTHTHVTTRRRRRVRTNCVTGLGNHHRPMPPTGVCNSQLRMCAFFFCVGMCCVWLEINSDRYARGRCFGSPPPTQPVPLPERAYVRVCVRATVRTCTYIISDHLHKRFVRLVLFVLYRHSMNICKCAKLSAKRPEYVRVEGSEALGEHGR